MIRIYFFIISCFALVGCGAHQMHFDCKASKGAGCVSVSDINEMVSRHELPRNKPTLKAATFNFNTAKEDLNPANALTQSKSGTVMRTKEHVLRIWFNSYFDEHNNFQGDQYLYTVIEPAQWVVK